jgi:AcrR family transcriptional regulator
MNAKKNGIEQEIPDTSAEKNTKMRIFDASVDLFAQKGFDAVSMQEIADAVGIKKASLYYHFASKDQLLDGILTYPIERLGDISPRDVGTEELIASMGLEGFLSMSRDIVLKWMEAPYVDKTMRIIFVELYHNDRVKTFFTDFLETADKFWIQNFTTMIKLKLVKPTDPRVLAAEYLSFYSHAWLEYFLHRYGKSGTFREEYQERLDRHNTFMVSAMKA